ncbi:MAG: sporulation protein YlmC with PRC-barrel domain [Maribacter sp.]|jgi:sporulation protein YlmC with PRC-barrel domain
MKQSINSLLGYTIKGMDGEIGKVEEFYFDDRTSTIRYLVVKTGGWLSEKKVLISPEAFQKPELESKTFSVNLTQEKIKNSPDIDTDKPVSRKQEELIRGYYTWPGYYGNGMYGYPGFGMWGYPLVEVRGTEKKMIQRKAKEHAADNSHLRSTDEVTGYTIHATDGDIGEVKNFIVEDLTWKIHFLVVETGNWFSEKKVLISPEWIKDVKWEEQKVTINHSKDGVKNSPEYDSSQPINDAYEHSLNDYYEK